MKKLILFSRNFPYTHSEVRFITNELPYLLERFSEIYIVCSLGSNNRKPLVNLPNNVHVIDCYSHTKVLRNIVYPLGAVAHIFDNDARWRQIKKYESPTLKNKIYYGYDLSRVKYRTKKIIGAIRNLELDPKETILYSYWFNDIAYMAHLVNNSVFDGRCKIVSRAHGYDLYDRSKVAYCLKSLAIEKIDVVYACSVQGREYLWKKFPEYKEKIKTSYLGTPDYGETDDTKSDVFKICSCSYIKDVKRVDLILYALSRVHCTDVKIEWVHFGDGANKAHLLQSRADEILPDNIKAVFWGSIDNSDLIKIYKNQKFDLFINVSSSEGLPVSIMEATSFGMPIIATDVGGTSEIVGNDNGVLLDCDFSIEELASLIEAFAHLDSTQREIYRQNSRKKWEENFNSERKYRDFAKILSE